MRHPNGSARSPVSLGDDLDGATYVDSARHPAVRRVRDVLRGPATGVQRTFIVDDAVNLDEAARWGVSIDSVYVRERTDLDGDVVARAVRGELPLFVLSKAVTDDLFARSRTSRVFALARRSAPPSLADVTRRTGDVVVLDGVRVPGNIGAITRTAVAFGAAGIVLVDSGLRSTVDRRIVRASRGLAFALPLALGERAEVLEHLRRNGMPLAVMDPHGQDEPATLAGRSDRLAIVLGSEIRGHSDLLADAADLHVRIPIRDQVESLNVAATAAIILHQRARVRAVPV